MKPKLKRSQPLMGITIAAEQCGVSPAMLKKLEAGKLKGVLNPLRIADGSKSIRGYSPADIQAVMEFYGRRGRGPQPKTQKD